MSEEFLLVHSLPGTLDLRTVSATAALGRRDADNLTTPGITELGQPHEIRH